MTNDTTPLVVAIAGSRRDPSATRTACRTALEAARSAGAETDLIDLRSCDLPTLDPGADDAGDAAHLRERVAAADAVLLGTPNYHGSYSGVLKNALDYLGRDEFENTTVGLLTVAGGGFARPPLGHLREVCRTLDAWTLPHDVAIPNAHSNVSGGEINDARLDGRVRELGEKLVAYAGVDRYPRVACPAEPATGD